MKAYMFFPYMLMYVVREPSVPKRDRDGKLILSYPILRNAGEGEGEGTRPCCGCIVVVSALVSSWVLGTSLLSSLALSLALPLWPSLSVSASRLSLPRV